MSRIEGLPRTLSGAVLAPSTTSPAAPGQVIVAMAWRFALQTPQGLTVSLLPNAEDREVRYQRNTPAELELRLDHEAPDAYDLFEQLDQGVPIIRGWRLEPQVDLSMRPVCRFAGQVMALSESTDEGITVTARMPPARLEHLYTAEVDDHPFEDDGSIARQLVEDAPLSAHRLTVASVEAGSARDLTYENRQRLEALRELTELLDGFDYDTVAVGEGSTLANLVIMRRQGTERPGSKFGYGEGTVANCAGAERTWLPPRNRVRVVGEDGVTQTRDDPESIARYGLWEATDTMAETIDAGALGARAQELLSAGWRRYVTFTPDPWAADDEGRLITPIPGLHYWLGDTCQVTVRKGAWRSENDSRIDSIKISVGNDGFESGHALAITDDELGG